MSRRFIWIASVFMGFAMASLILVQAYWLKNAVLIKQKQFEQLILGALMDIKREIEQRETSEIIMNLVNPLSQDSGQFIAPGPGNLAGKSPGNMSMGNDRRKQVNEWLKDRREFVDRVIAGMFLVSPRIEDRISTKDLEQIIRKVFDESGIDLDVEYAIIRFNNEIALQSPAFNRAAEANFYNIQLFPLDINTNSNFLWIYFPGKNSFIYTSLNYLAISSLVLSLVIVVSFVMTIFIMFRQKRLSEIRNDFVSNMTHELKTPISTISLASQMLGDKSIPAEIKNTEQIAKIITEECRRLGNQVEKVLQTAVFDKGKLKLRLSESDMHEIITGVIDNFAIQIKSRNGKITASLDAENCFLQVDQVHITNVLSNLFDNAIKYCNRVPEIHVSTANRGGFLLIAVQDNGIGINKTDQKRIFEKFYRVPTGNIHTVKGFGLGLSYVKMIVEAHHGYVDLASELYEGSTFTLYLPIKE